MIHSINKINKMSGNKLPEQLGQLAQPPKQLFVMGELVPLLNTPKVAIVGSRKVSSYGREITARFASELARAGVTIISGLALGVDSIAHRACLEAGGKTIAVLPTPCERIYPAAHRGLAEQIVASGGALVSEYQPGDFVGRVNFVARNRIVSALADAVLVTEAALKSGSLHTARYALELGRDVLTVPGNITSITSEGTNNLLKRGAIPITDVGDILFTLGIEQSQARTKKVKSDDPTEQTIVDLLATGLKNGAELLEKSNLETSEFNQALTMLELKGLIRSLGADQWTLS